MGSRGSIIPLFLDRLNHSTFPITDIRMTRFMITLEEGVKLVWQAFEDMKGGEIYVKENKIHESHGYCISNKTRSKV